MRVRWTADILWLWLLVAAGIRLVSAWTHASWNHPDEWFQTMELARLLMGHPASYVQEIGLHLRNLSWPTLLTIPLGLAEWLAPEWIRLHVFLSQAFAGMLDLGMVWGWYQVARWFLKGRSPAWLHLAMALLVLPYHTVADSVRLSGEHLSTVLFWASLGLWISRGSSGTRVLAAAVLAVGCAAMKYPSGLLSVGLALGFWMTATGKGERLRILGGLVAGLLLWGLPDWIFYGRPWESLWMYIQYNLLSGAGVEHFGAQSAWEYWPLFRGHWFTALAPVGYLLAVGIPFGMAAIFNSRSALLWLIPSGLYLAGHFWVEHKETRFLVPVEFVLVWIGFTGWTVVAPKIPVNRWLKRAAWALGLLVLVVNGARGLHQLWGETWRPSLTYFEVNRHLREVEGACAVWTQRHQVTSILFPHGVPFGVLEEREGRPHQVHWALERPECAAARVLVHVGKPNPVWETEYACRLLSSGVLAWIPQSRWTEFQGRGWVSGPWYDCPGSVVTQVPHHQVDQPFARTFGRYEALPWKKMSVREIVEFGQRAVPHPHCRGLCVAQGLQIIMEEKQ